MKIKIKLKLNKLKFIILHNKHLFKLNNYKIHKIILLKN